jgi:hypothetical protein
VTAAAHDPWTRRLARLDHRLDRHMAETVRVEPMVRGDHRIGADPARPPFDVAGVLTIKRGETDIGGQSTLVHTMRIRTAGAELAIMRDKLPAGAILRKGDRITVLATGLTYTVERLDREHEGRLILTLAAEGGAP